MVSVRVRNGLAGGLQQLILLGHRQRVHGHDGHPRRLTMGDHQIVVAVVADLARVLAVVEACLLYTSRCV